MSVDKTTDPPAEEAQLAEQQPAETKKSFWATLMPVVACGAGLFSDGYINNVLDILPPGLCREMGVGALTKMTRLSALSSPFWLSSTPMSGRRRMRSTTSAILRSPGRWLGSLFLDTCSSLSNSVCGKDDMLTGRQLRQVVAHELAAALDCHPAGVYGPDRWVVLPWRCSGHVQHADRVAVFCKSARTSWHACRECHV